MCIQGATSAPYQPKTIGVVERVNETLVGIIKKLAEKCTSSWDQHLSTAIMAYQFTVYSQTGFSPFKTLYRRHLGLPGHLIKLNMDPTPKPMKAN